MVLQEENQWENYFLAVGIPEEASKQYATKFHENHITEVSLPMLDRQFLQELGITIIGDIMGYFTTITKSTVSTLSKHQHLINCTTTKFHT